MRLAKVPDASSSAWLSRKATRSCGSSRNPEGTEERPRACGCVPVQSRGIQFRARIKLSIRNYLEITAAIRDLSDREFVVKPGIVDG